MEIDLSILVSFIDRSLVQFYDTHLFSEYSMSFNEYIISLKLPVEEYYTDLSAYKRFFKKARIKTKINWYKGAIRDLQDKKAGSLPVEAFEVINSSPEYISSPITWDKYVEDYTIKLDDWRKVNSFLLTEYPYIHLSSVKSKELAFNKEVVLNIIDLLEKNIGVDSGLGYSHDVLLQPLEFLFGPLVSVNSPGVQLSSTVPNPEKEGSIILYDDYRVPYTDAYGDLIIRSLVEKDSIAEQEINLRTLSAFDVSLLLYIVNYVCESDYATFLSTRTFQNEMSAIVKSLYPNESKPSARCYAQVRKSLSKLALLHINYYRDGELIRHINFFDSYEVYEEEGSNRKVVTLTLGKYMYDRISTNKTQVVFAHEVQLLQDRTSQFIYFVLENERQRAYATSKINNEIELSYTFFLHMMRFPSRNSVKNNMLLIESAFKVFIENDILLLSYKKKPKSFLIKFKPFRKEDIAKLRLVEPSLIPVIA